MKEITINDLLNMKSLCIDNSGSVEGKASYHDITKKSIRWIF